MISRIWRSTSAPEPWLPWLGWLPCLFLPSWAWLARVDNLIRHQSLDFCWLGVPPWFPFLPELDQKKLTINVGTRAVASLATWGYFVFWHSSFSNQQKSTICSGTKALTSKAKWVFLVSMCSSVWLAEVDELLWHQRCLRQEAVAPATVGLCTHRRVLGLVSFI